MRCDRRALIINIGRVLCARAVRPAVKGGSRYANLKGDKSEWKGGGAGGGWTMSRRWHLIASELDAAAGLK